MRGSTSDSRSVASDAPYPEILEEMLSEGGHGSPEVINRTLIYGSLSALLALVCFLGVAATEALFRTLTCQVRRPQLATVISTLVIAALFHPLRCRIRGFIDRRFYRRKYDARKTLEALPRQAQRRDGS